MGRRKTAYNKTTCSLFILYSCLNNDNNSMEYLTEELDVDARQIKRYVLEINLMFADFFINKEIKYIKKKRAFEIVNI